MEGTVYPNCLRSPVKDQLRAGQNSPKPVRDAHREHRVHSGKTSHNQHTHRLYWANAGYRGASIEHPDEKYGLLQTSTELNRRNGSVSSVLKGLFVGSGATTDPVNQSMHIIGIKKHQIQHPHGQRIRSNGR